MYSQPLHQQILPNATNVWINGGLFSNVQGDYHQYNTNKDTGFQALGQHIASGAMFNSSERFPPGKCHPGTREKAIGSLKDWILDPNSEHNIVWLYGPAGSGKSAIAQSIAELLWELHRDKYGGSFFFSAGNKSGRGDGSKIFATLAYQLAVQFPCVLPFINDALLADPTLPTRSMEVQLKALIVNPIMQASNIWPCHAPTIIIDGLDECANSTSQTYILSLIYQSIHQYNVPLRFLVSSRPEYWIRDAFEVGPLERVTRPISLSDIGDMNRDIERYLVAEFADICTRYRHVMSAVEQPWPPARFIKRFVEESSGHFIYASTVIRFIGHSDFCDPREQLRILTTSSPHRAAAFSNLDALYAAILGRVPIRCQAAMKSVLGGVILGLELKVIETFLGVESADIALISTALSSLIELRPEPHKGEDALKMLYGPSGAPTEIFLRLSHLSFREFLQNEPRSGNYFVDTTAIANQFVLTHVNIIGNALDQRSDIEEHRTHAMRPMSFHNMLVSIPGVPFHQCDMEIINGFFQKLDLKMNNFLACDSAHIKYSIFLLRYMDALSYWCDASHDRISSISDSLNFDKTLARTRQKIVQYLAANQSIDITPLAFYAFLGRGLFSVPDMRSLPEVDLSTEIHNPLLDIIWYRGVKDHDRIWQAHFGILNPLASYIRTYAGDEWLAHWNDQAMQLLCLCMKVLHDDAIKYDNDSHDPDLLLDSTVDLRRSILGLYFEDSKFSAPKTRDLLQNPNGRILLTLILDVVMWRSLRMRDGLDIRLLKSRGQTLTLIVMRWLHRLLRDPLSNSLIAEYDKSLPACLSRAIVALYEHHFLPDCQTDRYLTECTLYNIEVPNMDSSVLDMSPDESECYEDTTGDLSCSKFQSLWAFQRDFFGREGSNIIERGSWYRHLAAYLLNMLVKHQYYLLPRSQFQDLSRHIHNFSPYITEILPYAYPSEQNLDALRELRFLSSKIPVPWHPPPGFFSCVSALLVKYERPSLSIEELDDFFYWLTSLLEEGDTAIEDDDFFSMEGSDDENSTDIQGVIDDEHDIYDA